MKLSIVGGSSPYTVNLFAHGRASAYLGAFHTIMLQGRTRENLDHVQSAARNHCEYLDIQVGAETELERALHGADVVLVQPRYGGLELRARIEDACARHRVFADETLGVGGLATAACVYQQWRALGAQLAATCPDALIVNMINPLSLSCAAFHAAGCHTVGLCEGPLATACFLAAQLSSQDQTFDWACTGFNHRAFIYGLHVDGQAVAFSDVSKLQLPKHVGTPEPEIEALVSKELAQAQKPRNWTYGRATSVAQMRTDALNALARTGDIDTKRPTPWIDEAVLPFLGAWSGWTSTFETTLNTHDNGVFRESRHTVGQMQIARKHQLEPSPAIKGRIVRFDAHERAALSFLGHEPKQDVRDVLALDPTIDARHLNAAGRAFHEVVNGDAASSAATDVPLSPPSGV